MDTYLDTLAPWEERRAYYSNIKPGNKIVEVKEALKKQTRKMISAQIAPAGSIISSQERKEDVIHDIEYDMRSIGQGMRGLKAAFEWGISDVVWLIEMDREDLKGIIMALCGASNKQTNMLRGKAEDAYASGKMDNALVYLTELEPHTVKDFSVCISLGMIYLFHKIDKEKALEYFERAVKNARSLSAYYASYALLYKALIKRDFGLIAEAEECTNEAIKLSPDFTEAMYQNAQYNALLNRPEKAVSLLKKAIKEDVNYCLKISGERDFNGIKSEIIKLYEEIRNEKSGEVKEKLEGEKKSVVLLNNAVKGIQKLGYDVPKDSSVELFQKNENGENSEIDKMMENNSIFDAHIADILLTLLSKKLKRKKERLRIKSNEIHRNIDKQIQELSAGMAGKKKSGLVSFLIFLLCGQIVAFPFGWYIGIPIGICITEGILFFICLYVSVILPQSKWKEIHGRQNEKDKLLRVMKKI
ncbi:MAG: tetratricopeptide repeat protein [Candidatus Scalindua sp.]